MTPKEKAKELISKYSFVEIANYTSIFEVKQCALIAVDEILDELDEILNITGSSFIFEVIDYWQEVKKEIEKYG